MARSFLGILQQQYIGIPSISAIKFRGIAGISVPLLFNWLIYGASTSAPNKNVRVDLGGAQVATKLQNIRSVYIDNMGSDVPIYVNAPDTGYTIVAKPNSSGWYPIYTNGLLLEIIGQGFFTGNIPVTKILVTNLTIDPSIDDELSAAQTLWKASNTISRGNTIYNSNLGIPTLGDQTVQPLLNIAVDGNVTDLFPVQANGFYYVNSYFASVLGCSTAASTQVNLFVESTGISGVLFSFVVILFAGQIQALPVPLGHQNGLNLKIDATQQWRIRNSGAMSFAGLFSFICAFTFNPN